MGHLEHTSNVCVRKFIGGADVWPLCLAYPFIKNVIWDKGVSA
jgi:hypothetical protein